MNYMSTRVTYNEFIKKFDYHTDWFLCMSEIISFLYKSKYSSIETNLKRIFLLPLTVFKPFMTKNGLLFHNLIINT